MSFALRAVLAVMAAALLSAAVLRGDPPVDSKTEAEPPAYVRVPLVEGIPGPLFFETPTLAFVPKGTLRVTTGARFLAGVTLPASGLAGDLSELGMVRVDVGFGSRIEVRIQGAFRRHLRIDADRSRIRPPAAVTGQTTHDTGDFSFITLAQVMPERGLRPAVGLRVEAKLPNSNERRGIGTNTTDVLLSVPIQKQLGRLFVVSDLGLGILTVPTDAQAQDDVLLYGLAAAWKASPRWMLSGELVGRWAPAGGHPGTGDRSSLRAGIAWMSGPNAVGLALSRGLVADEEDLGVMLAVSHGFRVHDRVRAD